MASTSRSRARPTIQDVARAARVVPSTVSHVLNGTAPIGKEVRERVLRAVRELNYRPNAVARSLITGRTMTVGLVVAEMADPFFPDIVGGVEAALGAAGYDLLLCNAAGNVGRTQQFLASLAGKYVDAVIAILDGLDPEIVRSLAAAAVPAVLAGLAQDAPVVARIGVDLAPGLEAACRHLWGLGHRRLALMTDDEAPDGDGQCAAIALAAWERCGGRREDLVTIQGADRLDGGRRALAALLALRPRPGALLACSDLAAIGVLQAAEESGLRIPRDLSVIGRGDLLMATLAQPPLTTISLPRWQLGGAAVARALALIHSGAQEDGGGVAALPASLVVRRSTCPPPA